LVMINQFWDSHHQNQSQSEFDIPIFLIDFHFSLIMSMYLCRSKYPLLHPMNLTDGHILLLETHFFNIFQIYIDIHRYT
jgi:hypothetical protein